MPDLPAGSGAVISTTLPDFTGALGGALKGGLGVAATVMRNVESAGVKVGVETASRATDLPLIKMGTQEWKDAVDNLSTLGKGKLNLRTETATDAKSLLNEAKGNMNRYKNYTNESHKNSYETHNVQNSRELGRVLNEGIHRRGYM